MEDAHIAEKELYAECPHKSVDEGGFEKINVPDHALFACFDGHGGCFAAEYAGRNLCRVLSRQPKFIRYAKFAQEREKQEQLLKSSADRAHYVRAGMEMLEGALRDAFIDLDREIFRATRGEVEPGANAPYHGPALPEAAANKNETMDSIEGSNENPANDEKANKDPSPNEDEDSGTTAVVVMVTPHVVICANAGDSRAVLSKNGHKALPLSYDHKPDDEEEERRIRAAGGYVAGGRVEGDLAVSRGFGDFRFKNAATVLAGATGFNERKETEEKVTEQNSTIMKADEQKVSPVPDIIIQNRSEQDEFIVVACDGIWDVQTNYECVKTVTDIFQEGESDLGLVCEEVS
jgi:serine/threonine protein phosphatase PrpC